MSTLKAIKSPFETSYNKQNITLVVFSYDMTIRVKSSINVAVLYNKHIGYHNTDRIYNTQVLVCAEPYILFKINLAIILYWSVIHIGSYTLFFSIQIEAPITRQRFHCKRLQNFQTQRL